MKSTILATILATSLNAFAANCPFEGVNVHDLKKDRTLTVSREAKTKIPRNVFWANKKFFENFKAHDCKGSYMKATVTEKKTKKSLIYYRTNTDECDGGNTYGVIVPVDGSKAVSYIQDGDITCERPE